jgi:hypothetical protein
MIRNRGEIAACNGDLTRTPYAQWHWCLWLCYKGLAATPIWWGGHRSGGGCASLPNHNENSKMVAERAFLSGNILVRAPVDRAEDWRWSSVRAHLAGKDDGVVTVAPALDRIGNFATFLSEDFDQAMTYATLRNAESVGRPIGSKEWITNMEARTGRTLAPQKRGPKPRTIAFSAPPYGNASSNYLTDVT